MPQRLILVVDDSLADRTLLKIAFERAAGAVKVLFATSAAEALDLMRGARPGYPPTKPHLILLDFKMAGMSGLSLLKTLKNDEVLRAIPVLIFSGSDDPSDVYEAYSSHAAGYIQKPASIEQLTRVAGVIGELCNDIFVFAH